MILFSQLPTYQMRAGDTLYSVARRNGITPMDLLAVNPNISAHSARAGTVVRIPYVGMTTRMAKATMPPAGTPESAPQGSEATEYEAQDEEVPEGTPDCETPVCETPEGETEADEMLYEEYPEGEVPPDA